MPRGAQPAGRAGANVASADNTHALWYNPAGLSYLDREVLLDFTVPMMQARFTRLMDAPRGQPQRFAPSVDADSKYLPIPTLAYGEDFGRDDVGLALGIIIPAGVVPNWPQEIRVDGQRRPAPQRYSILNNEGTAFAIFALGGAYRPLKWLRVGASLLLSWGQFGAKAAVSVCDFGPLCAQPEAPEWQAESQFLMDPFVTVGANFGLTLDFEIVRVGLSAQLPTKVEGEGRFDVALPDQAIFDQIEIDGERARVSTRMPAILRGGVDVALLSDLRLELAGSYQAWSVQDTVTVRPEDIVVRNIPTIGELEVKEVALPRNMRDTWSVHLGGAYELSRYMPAGRQLQLTAGVMFERGAFDERNLTPITLDADKWMLALGFAVELAPSWLVDVSLGHLFMKDYKVRNSTVLLPSALKPIPTDDDPSPNAYEPGDRTHIANGNYVMEASFFALGVRYLFGRGPQPGPKPNPGYRPEPERYGY